MGSSFGSLYGNQEMGNGDAEVHGFEKDEEGEGSWEDLDSIPLPLEPAPSVLLPSQEAAVPSTSQDMSCTSGDGNNGTTSEKSRKQKKKSRGRKQKALKAKALQDVRDALDELEIGDSEGAASVPVDQQNGGSDKTPTELIQELDLELECLSICSDESTQQLQECKSTLKIMEQRMNYICREASIKRKRSPVKKSQPTVASIKTAKQEKAKGRNKPKAKFSPGKSFIAKTQSVQAVDSDVRNPKRRNRTPSVDEPSFEFVNAVINLPCPAATANSTFPTEQTSPQNSVEKSRKRSSSLNGRKPFKRILKAKRKKPLNLLTEAAHLQQLASDPPERERQSERTCKIEKVLTSKMHKRGLNDPKFHGLTEELWQKILTCLCFRDLKTFRLVSPDTNYLVEISLSWAMNACFLFDAEAESKTLEEATKPSVCPPELICDDNTLGWPDVRLKNIKNPFSVMTFWYSPDVRGSIRFLEIKNCLLCWSDIHNLVCGLQNMEEFSYILTEDFVRQNDVYSTLVNDYLDLKNYDVQQSLKMKLTKQERESKKSPRSRRSQFAKLIKKIVLNVLNLEFTNILLAVLEFNIFHELQELRIFLANDLFLNVPFYPDPTSFKQKKELRARRIIESNQETLTSLQISCDRVTSSRPLNPLLYVARCPTLPMVNSILSLNKLSLKELIIELPVCVPIYFVNEEFCGIELESGKYQAFFPTLSKFSISQKSTLTHLRLSSIDLNAGNNIPYDLIEAIKDAPMCDFEMGGKLVCGDDHNPHPHWEKLKHVLVDVKVSYMDVNAWPYNHLISETMPVMMKVKSFDLRSWAKDLRAFNIPIIASKFPNLTCLILGDSKIRAEGLKNAPTVDNKDFQTILVHLPQLVELVIKCNMAELSDFGLTGISDSACYRMAYQNSFIRKPGDVVGHSLSCLKKLELVELHGIGDGVTNVSAYLAFKDLPNLQELYLFSPKFSRLAKKLLKERFRLRNGFQIIIN